MNGFQGVKGCRWLAWWIFMSFSAINAWAYTVDLNTFNAPVGNVVISANGLSAAFTESAEYGPISLENLTLPIPSDGISLSFNYQLTVPENNVDYFDFYINNISTPLLSYGGQPGVYTGIANVGVGSFAGTSIPAIFSFMYGNEDLGLDSVLTISNLEVNTSAVPVPGGLLLLGSGVLGLLGIRLINRRS